MLDKLFFIILVLNATGLFRFVAPQAGVDIGTVSLALLGLQGMYIGLRWRTFLSVYVAEMKLLLFVLLLWPLVTALYAPAVNLREIGLQFYYVSLLVGTVVFTTRNGLSAMHRVVTVSLVLAVGGMILSMIVPEYFRSVAILADARNHYQGRAYGFWMQPNNAGTGLAFLFTAWYAMWRCKNTLLQVPVLLAFLLAAFLTGSRTTVIVATLIVGLILYSSWRKGANRNIYRTYVKVCIFALCVAVGVLWARIYLQSHHVDKGLLDRVSALVHFRLTSEGNILYDGSIQERLEAQNVYWSLIREKPILGHGFAANRYYLEYGPVYVSSHSTLITYWMEYGVIYPFVFCYTVIRLYLCCHRPDAERFFESNSVLQFVAIMLLLFIVNGSLLNARVVYVIWGVFFLLVYRPFFELQPNQPPLHFSLKERRSVLISAAGQKQ